MTKEEELDDMELRAHLLATYLGRYPPNDYVCFICQEEGRERDGATFLDWPHAIQVATGLTACFAHRDDSRVIKVEDLPRSVPQCPHCGGELAAIDGLLAKDGKLQVACGSCHRRFVATINDGPPDTPLACRSCHTVLPVEAPTFYNYRCPGCEQPCCYNCGCTKETACALRLWNGDHTSKVEIRCAWDEKGICNFCVWRSAYEHYQRVTGRPANDPVYMRLGRQHA